MRLTIDFEGPHPIRWLERRRRELACRWFGHPAFAAPYGISLFLGSDNRPRCTRCHAPDPEAPEPEPYTHTITFGDGMRVSPVQVDDDGEPITGDRWTWDGSTDLAGGTVDPETYRFHLPDDDRPAA